MQVKPAIRPSGTLRADGGKSAGGGDVTIRSLGRAVLAIAAAGALAEARAATPAAKPPAAEARKPAELIQAEPPPFSEGIFPCSACHVEPGDRTRRELAFHEEIRLDHGPPENRWCLDCHDSANRDVLHLTNGDPVPFTESYRLCGQCHGDKYRDWRRGVHGKRVGQWDGRKTYHLCVHCHNPHSPAFRALEPEPPPVRPEEMRK
jgi:hypothetical protein